MLNTLACADDFERCMTFMDTLAVSPSKESIEEVTEKALPSLACAILDSHAETEARSGFAVAKPAFTPTVRETATAPAASATAYFILLAALFMVFSCGGGML